MRWNGKLLVKVRMSTNKCKRNDEVREESHFASMIVVIDLAVNHQWALNFQDPKCYWGVGYLYFSKYFLIIKGKIINL